MDTKENRRANRIGDESKQKLPELFETFDFSQFYQPSDLKGTTSLANNVKRIILTPYSTQ
jgi:hypothetical protein